MLYSDKKKELHVTKFVLATFNLVTIICELITSYLRVNPEIFWSLLPRAFISVWTNIVCPSAMCIQVRPFDQALLNSFWDLNPLYAFHVLAYPVINTIASQCKDFFPNLCMNI